MLKLNFQSENGKIHGCTRIGDKLICLADLFPQMDGPLFKSLNGNNIFDKDTLNDFAMAMKTGGQ